MKKMILFVVSFLAATQVWAQQSSTAAPDSSIVTVSADNVQIEEYVPKVIIQGKWGTGPGEFGVAWTYASNINSPEDPSGEIPPIYPSSLAVDSKGNIYVLDTVNNRIQKFNAMGKHLKSIEVESYAGKDQQIFYGKVKNRKGEDILDVVDSKEKSGSTIGTDAWFPFYWPLTAVGINIVIDSKDTLYYYLKRTKEGKETGEVWEFKNDKLVDKMVVPVAGNLDDGIEVENLDDSLWSHTMVVEGQHKVTKDYNVKKRKVYSSLDREIETREIKKDYLKKGINKKSFRHNGRSYSEPLNLEVARGGIIITKIIVVKRKR